MLGVTVFSLIVKVVFGFQFKSEKYEIVDIYINILKLHISWEKCMVYACFYFVKTLAVYLRFAYYSICTL